MKIRNIELCILAVAAFAVAGVYWWSAPGIGADAKEVVAPDEGSETADTPRRTDAKAAAPKPTVKPSARIVSDASRLAPQGVRVATVVDVDDRDDLSPEEKRQMRAIEKAMDEEDVEQLRRILPEASVSTNDEIRSDLVDALGWFGTKTMTELLPFMADPNADIREDAIDYWTTALSDISGDRMRASVVESAMMVVTDEDALETMTTELTDMDEHLALQVIVNVIESGKAPAVSVAAAREEYEFITGDEYTTLEAANAWMEENYDPPSQDDSAGEIPSAG